jgi:putative SOS response-associated peptidase YedK
MCGRYTLRTPIDVLAEGFEIQSIRLLSPLTTNVAPTQEVRWVVEEEEKGS